MRIAYLTAGAAGMYCGTCMHDNTLAAALIERGHDVALVPAYTPMRSDEETVAIDRVFFGAINVFLQQKWALFRHTPWLLDRLLDRPRLLSWVSRFAGATDGAQLGALTLSMLEGEDGHQAKELDKLVRWLEEDLRPDVVHLSFSLFLGFAPALRRRLGVPIVCSFQGEDLFLEELDDHYRQRVTAAMRRQAAHVDAFAAPCRDHAERMAEVLALDPTTVATLRLGIRHRDFATVPALEPGDGPVTIGFLARQCPEKGLHLLVDAFRQLAADPSLPPLRLRVAGFVSERDAAFVDEQRRRLDSWGLTERVDLLGEVDRDAKVAFLATTDLFALPTVYREPKGLSVLEAMAAGRPAVVPRHGTFPEMIAATGGGITVEPRSADALAAGLRELVIDGERRRALGEAARRGVAEHYGREAITRDHLDLYERLLAGARPAAPPAASPEHRRALL